MEASLGSSSMVGWMVTSMAKVAYGVQATINATIMTTTIRVTCLSGFLAVASRPCDTYETHLALISCINMFSHFYMTGIKKSLNFLCSTLPVWIHNPCSVDHTLIHSSTHICWIHTERRQYHTNWNSNASKVIKSWLMTWMNSATIVTDLSELPQEFSITEKDNSKRQNEAGAEEGNDVAVIGHVVGIPVQRWTKNVSF